MKEIITFLEELQVNNNREWFNENKERYTQLRDYFLLQGEALIQKIAQFDHEIQGLNVKDCVYRIYRDTRFSHDKTPYKTYFSIYVARGGKKSPRAGYYLHIEPGNSIMAGGIWSPEPPLLKALRTAIYDNYDELCAILQQPEFKRLYPEFEGETLKTVPRPFPRDCEQAELLKRKDYTVIHREPNSFFEQPDWMDKTVKDMQVLYSFNRFLNYTVDEFLNL